MPVDRTPEEQAELDRRYVEAMEAVERENQLRHEMALAFVTPRHLRRDVVRAIKAPLPLLQNWQARNQVQLDADTVRDGAEWRLYSTRDVLMLGIAARLSEVGFRASLLQKVLDQVKPALRIGSRIIGSNVPSFIVVLTDGTVIGPQLGSSLDIADIPKGNFIVIRLDNLIREALEPLGYSITSGNADDMQETVDRLRVAHHETRETGE